MAVFYLGRAICGLGIGGSTTVIPIYLSEMGPKNMRAQPGSSYQFTFTVGILVSYWVEYGMQFRTPTAAQWQIPLALHHFPGALMGRGMLTLDESVRRPLCQGNPPHAWARLTWIRAADGPEVALEFAQIKEGIEAERHATAGFQLHELLKRSNARCLLLGIGLIPRTAIHRRNGHGLFRTPVLLPPSRQQQFLLPSPYPHLRCPESNKLPRVHNMDRRTIPPQTPVHLRRPKHVPLHALYELEGD